MTAVQESLLLDGDATTPELDALAAALSDVFARTPGLGHVVAGPALAAAVAGRLRDAGFRVAPVERLPVALQIANGEVENLAPRHRAVYDVLVRFGALPDHDLVAVYEAMIEAGTAHAELGGEIPAQSASSIRSRRVELVRAGLVEDSGLRRQAPGGGKAKVWRVARP